MAENYVNQVEFLDENGDVIETHDIQDIDNAELARVDGAYEQMTVGNAEQLISDSRDTNLIPYLFRQTGGGAEAGDRKYVKDIVGGSVAWNQLLYPTETGSNAGITYTNNEDGSITVSGTSTATSFKNLNRTTGEFVFLNDHIYLIKGATAKSGLRMCYTTSGTMTLLTVKSDAVVKVTGIADATTTWIRVVVAGSVTVNETIIPQLFDLTQMFGSAVADYVYSLEQATEGAGVAKLKSWGFFNDRYYPYNTGSIKSVSGLVSSDTIGFNQWDEEWANGYFDTTTGAFIESATNTALASKNYIHVISGHTYCIKQPTNSNPQAYQYDADKNYIGRLTGISTVNGTFTVDNNCHYIKFIVFGYGTGIYNHDICINISDSDRNGEYEAYKKHSYPLDSSLTLLGFPKLDSANELYYDGDVYESDGAVTRNWKLVDLGSLNWTYSGGTANLRFVADVMSDIVAPTAGTVVADALCSKYQVVTEGQVFANTKVGLSITTTKRVMVYDPSYTDAATFKAAMSGVYLVCGLETATTETADPYTELQIIDNLGTEAFVVTPDADGVAIPVGHTTEYPLDLKGKLESAPNNPSTNGTYIVQYLNGVASYIPLGSDTTIASILQRLTALEGGS